MFELYFLSHVIQIFTGEKHVSEERNKGKLQHKHLCRHMYNSAFDVLMFANDGKIRMQLFWLVFYIKVSLDGSLVTNIVSSACGLVHL